MLYRLERKKLVEGKWIEKAGERRRRYYRLTAGRERRWPATATTGASSWTPSTASRGSAMRDWKAWVRGSLRDLRIAPARESEIVAELAELAQHLEQVYRDARAADLSEDEAERQVVAASATGANWRVRSSARSSSPVRDPRRRAGLFTGTVDDVRHALRFLGRNPAFAAMAIGTLALGVGGNTAIFTMADALALRGLPYPRPYRLMAIETHWSRQSEIEPWTSAPDFFDLRHRAPRVSSGMAAASPVWNDMRTGFGTSPAPGPARGAPRYPLCLRRLLPPARRAARSGANLLARRRRPSPAPGGRGAIERVLAQPFSPAAAARSAAPWCSTGEPLR